jgi:TPR repeat protein
MRGRSLSVILLAAALAAGRARCEEPVGFAGIADAALTAVLAGAETRLAPYFAERRLPYPPRRVTFVALKDQAKLEVWADGGSGWTFVRSYLIRASSGRLGPKLRQGDHQVPEGVYRIAALNPNSAYHLSMRLDYPNAFDQARAGEDGRVRLGGDIMIHGDKVSDGCLPVGDTAVEELFALTARMGTADVAVVVSPVDLRRLDPAAAVARATDGRPWLGDLYTAIADALKDFQLPPDDAPIVTARRAVVTKPRCKAYDAADCVRRCGTGDVASCARVGLMYEDGRGVTADATKAWSYLQKACAGGDALGCAELSRLYVNDDGMRRDTARAVRLARAACDAGDGHGCSYLARLCIDRLVYPGTEARCGAEYERRLYERAVALLQKDCTGWGAYDCHTLATIYSGGDPRTALRFATGSCRAGDPGGCYELGRLREDSGDTLHAHDLYERACRVGYAPACDRPGVVAARAITSR